MCKIMAKMITVYMWIKCYSSKLYITNVIIGVYSINVVGNGKSYFYIIPLNRPFIFYQVRFALSVAVLANKFMAKGHSMAMETGPWRSVEMRQFHLVIDFPYPNALYNWWKIGIGCPYWSWEMEGPDETKRIGAERVTDFRDGSSLIYQIEFPFAVANK